MIPLMKVVYHGEQFHGRSVDFRGTDDLERVWSHGDNENNRGDNRRDDSEHYPEHVKSPLLPGKLLMHRIFCHFSHFWR
jgi:hypothetical protein